MNMYMFEEFVKTIISSENITFGSISPFFMHSEFVIALAIIVSVVIVSALVFVAKKNQKRQPERTQQIEEFQLISREKKTLLKGASDSPQNGMNLEELKGIGTKTAEKLRNVNIITVSDLSKASANVLSQKTGISEKLLSKWIEQANIYKRTEH